MIKVMKHLRTMGGLDAVSFHIESLLENGPHSLLPLQPRGGTCNQSFLPEPAVPADPERRLTEHPPRDNVPRLSRASPPTQQFAELTEAQTLLAALSP